MAAQPVTVQGGGAISHRAVSVGTSATPITAGIGQQTVSVFNLGAATIYVGNAGVTTATGYPVLPNQERLISCVGDIYAISGTAAQDVRVLVENL